MQVGDAVGTVAGIDDDAVAGLAAQGQYNAVAAGRRVRRKAELFGVFQRLHRFTVQPLNLCTLHAASGIGAGDFAAECLPDTAQHPLDAAVYLFSVHLLSLNNL